MNTLWIGAVLVMAVSLTPATAINFYSPKYYVSTMRHLHSQWHHAAAGA